MTQTCVWHAYVRLSSHALLYLGDVNATDETDAVKRATDAYAAVGMRRNAGRSQRYLYADDTLTVRMAR